MFNGIIRHPGRISRIDLKRGKLLIFAPTAAGLLRRGDSVCVDGICLTVTRIARGAFSLDITPETVRRTHLKWARRGWLVNLEPSLRFGDRIHGHPVLGHVDGVGIVESLVRLRKNFGGKGGTRPQEVLLNVRVPSKLAIYMAEKGSVALNGVSLTIARRRGSLIQIALIPETLRRTNLRFLKAGYRVNVEADVLARYYTGEGKHYGKLWT